MVSSKFFNQMILFMDSFIECDIIMYSQGICGMQICTQYKALNTKNELF